MLRIANTGFQYDSAGNLLANGTGTGSYAYTWNAEGRMSNVTPYGQAAVTYTGVYPERSRRDGDGRRTKKSNGKLYWYGVSGEVLAESDLSGTIQYEYIYFGGKRIARRTPAGVVHYYLADRLGSARVMVDANGNVVEESDFQPYGTEKVITDNLDNTYKFTGHERDTESGLDHTLHRQYASNMGRWLSPDSVRGKVGNPQSLNRYSYGANSPCNFVDPDGAVPRESNFYQPWYFGFFLNARAQEKVQMREEPGSDDPPFLPTDPVTNGLALGLLESGLKNWAGSGCDKAFKSALPNKYSTNGFSTYASRGNVEFIDVNRSRASYDGGLVGDQAALTYGDMTDTRVLGYGTGKSLNTIIHETPGGVMATAKHIGKGIILIGDFWGLSQKLQESVVIHEVLHAYTGLNDNELFSAFEGAGLVKSGFGSRDISDWIADNCPAPE